MGKKQYYENLIANSLLFSLDAEKEPSAYEREKNRLTEYVYMYKVSESSDNEEYALEIVETLKYCIKSYDKSKGDFLHYYNRAFSNRKKIEQTRATVKDNSSGIHYTENEMKNVRLVYGFLKSHGTTSPDDLRGILDDYSSSLNISKSEFEEAVIIYRNSMTKSGDMEISEDGLTLFDTLATEGDFTESYDSAENVKLIIDICDRQFNESRNDTKKLLSIKLTGMFASLDEDGMILEYIKEKEFFNQEICNYVYAGGKEIKNKDISIILDKSEANITQTWKRFLEKVKAAYMEGR